MKAFTLAIFCIAVSAAAASWKGGVAVVAPSAYGGAIAGGHAPVAVIAGPAGTVSTAGHGVWNGLGWAAGYGVAGPGLWSGAWNAGHGIWNGGYGAWAGSGHEGQWIPDINEKLYDDGSYKPEYDSKW